MYLDIKFKSSGMTMGVKNPAFLYVINTEVVKYTNCSWMRNLDCKISGGIKNVNKYLGFVLFLEFIKDS